MLDASMREHLKKHFRAFLHFLGDIEPKLERHTTYMQNMHKVVKLSDQWYYDINEYFNFFV